MLRYALVERATMVVIGIQILSKAPAPVQGFEYICETNWAPDVVAALDDIWNGQLPAGFAPPPPVEGVPTDLASLRTYLEQMKANIDVAIAGVENVQGG